MGTGIGTGTPDSKFALFFCRCDMLVALHVDWLAPGKQALYHVTHMCAVQEMSRSGSNHDLCRFNPTDRSDSIWCTQIYAGL